MTVNDAIGVLIGLASQGHGDAKLFTSCGSSGVCDDAWIGSSVNVVGDEDLYLDAGSILYEEDGTEVVFVHYN